MNLVLKRIALKDTYTIGKLYVNQKYFCDTLEDKVRDTNKDGKLDSPKIYGETAIPYGTYKVIITQSARFKRLLPLLLNVPGFEGIRIHPGNSAVDTHGCLLVGKNTEVGKVTNSKVIFDKLFEILTKALKDNEEITIKIE